MKNKKVVGLIVFLVALSIILLISNSTNSYGAELTPTQDQYMELKLVSTTPVDGQGTQAILELWSYNLEFKGVDVRFSYDNTKLNPSNIDTNILTTETDCFAFENGFEGFLEMFEIDEVEPNVLRHILALNPILDGEGNPTYQSTNAYLKNDPVTGDYVDTAGGVLIGRLSFKVEEGADLDETTFSLVTSATNSPLTGVKIAKTTEDYYSNQSVFRFTMILKGTVSGNIETHNSLGIYKATIKAYPSGTVDWVNLVGHTSLDSITPSGTIITNDDGTYSLELLEGKYDILIDKHGYLDHIYTNVDVIKNTDVDLGIKQLVPGDINKDGFVELEDMDKFYQNYGLSNLDYNFESGLDFTEDNIVELEDMDIFYQCYGLQKIIINKEEE